MTKEEYNRLAPSFNLQQHRINQAIDRIPLNVNRAGATYRRLIRLIRNRYEGYEQ